MRLYVYSGVPGMAARVAGAHHVVITEQDELLELMHRNLKDNASALRLGDSVALDDGGAIYARPLSWGVDETTAYLQQHGGETYDVILSCDCIYEPLYGESWKALAQTMELLCQQNPRALVMMGVERRNADGIDKFLSFVATETQLTWTLDEETTGAKDNVLQVYFLRLPSTASS
jgi:predicted nicotinamide N-methyase